MKLCLPLLSLSFVVSRGLPGKSPSLLHLLFMPCCLSPCLCLSLSRRLSAAFNTKLFNAILSKSCHAFMPQTPHSSILPDPGSWQQAANHLCKPKINKIFKGRNKNLLHHKFHFIYSSLWRRYGNFCTKFPGGINLRII